MAVLADLPDLALPDPTQPIFHQGSQDGKTVRITADELCRERKQT